MIDKQHPVDAVVYAKALLQPLKDTVKQLTHESLKKVIITGAMSSATAFVQDHLAGFMVLVALVVIDQITGVLAAIHKHTFSSFRFRAGILKLLVYSLLIVAFHIIGDLSPQLEAVKIDTIAIMYLAATEALSIIENAQVITGINLPEWIKKAIKLIGRKPQ